MSKEKEIGIAALRVFQEKGFHPTRIEDIAKAANIGKGTVYLYYKNKEDIVLSLFTEFSSKIEELLTWVYSSLLEGESVNDVLAKEAYELGEILGQHRETSLFILKEGRSVSEKVDALLTDFLDDLIERTEKTFRMLSEAGVLKFNSPDGPHVYAHHVVGGILLSYEQWLAGRMKADIHTAVKESLFFYQKALGLDLSSEELL